MALGADELIDEVKEIIGRSTDTVLITDDRATRFLNEAQDYIVRECPGLLDLEVKNTTSLSCVSGQVTYDLGDVTNTLVDCTNNSQYMKHVKDLWYIDGDESVKLDFMPIDEFDEKWPDPTSSDFEPGKPESWTRRGNNLEIVPRASSDYAGKTLRIDGTLWARDFTSGSTTASQLQKADRGLIYYAASEAWGAIGNTEEQAKYWTKFINWFNDFKTDNDRMLAWDGDVIFEGVD